MNVTPNGSTGPAPEPVYLTKQQFAARSGLSGSTVQRLKDAGRLPFYQPAGPGGKLLFPPDAIEAARRLAIEHQPPAAVPGRADDNPDPAGRKAAGTRGRERLSGPRARWRTDPAGSAGQR